jgi:N utilization substance protein A
MTSPLDEAESLVVALFSQEVPEVASGVVEIRAVARAPGVRTKVAVSSHDPFIDPVGVCVGERGARIKRIAAALHGEPIDLTPWLDAPERRIRVALAPTRLLRLELDASECRARAVVSQNDYTRALENDAVMRDLASRLTGWQIELRPDSDAA